MKLNANKYPTKKNSRLGTLPMNLMNLPVIIYILYQNMSLIVWRKMEAQFFNSSAKCERHLGLCHSQWTKHIMSQTTNHDVYDEMFMRFSREFHGIFMVSSDVHGIFMGISWDETAGFWGNLLMLKQTTPSPHGKVPPRYWGCHPSPSGPSWP